ncbi:glucose 1-dehydrogenase [Nocardioides panzhihuensis]|uniref:3alpha(Or 20beta)-hydroxysteroid dehydrogenase n=1 Tax=Nocardioides panzhihuensis TaxID=860243 RepID=A0A7Z0DHT4_9ACTN|nr:glucose 1-dehydrogenase [Nocardioides panzhihuensis]NYI75866.1 3alpha(or 20beta)-hydroxysteroid dehydrogenase [Nocardioides panzhihuensis]
MGQLDGKVAIITGAAQGMGEAHVRRFVAEGARVVMADINEDEGRRIAKELGERVVFVKADVTSVEDWRTLVQTASSEFGNVTVLVNNAGILGPIAETVEISEEDFHTVCLVNQYSQFYGMKAVIPFMQKAGGGSIVNVSSVAGLVSIVGAPNLAYVGSKFASRGMTKHVAAQYGKDNIRANSVHPGYIKTPMMAAATDEEGGGIVSQIPLGRMADPDEVAQLVVWLASEASSYVSGTEQVIDAGLTAQ